MAVVLKDYRLGTLFPSWRWQEKVKRDAETSKIQIFKKLTLLAYGLHDKLNKSVKHHLSLLSENCNVLFGSIYASY